MTPDTVISMISMGRPEGARKSLDALFAARGDAHVILTANGCKETGELFLEYKAKYDNVEVFIENENTFFQPPHNRAFQIAKDREAKYLLILNDDLLISPGDIEKLKEPLEKDDKAALSGAKGACQMLSPDMHGGPGERLDYIEGSMLMVKIASVSRHRENLWCPGLEKIYSEDSSLSLYLQEKGYTIHTVDIHPEHERSVTVNRDEQTRKACKEAQDRNHEVTKKRFAWWLQHGDFAQPIIVKRAYAIGDVLLTEPVIRAIKYERPLSPIYIETDFPELFTNHPDVKLAAKKLPSMLGAMVIDLNGSYERTTNTHIIHAYRDVARQQIPDLPESELKTKLYLNEEDRRWIKWQREDAGINSDKVCLICPDQSWVGKTWNPDKWAELAERLVNNGWHVVSVGTKDKPPQITHCIDCHGRFTLRNLAALMETCQLFIGHDSGPMHLALSVGCPTIGLFGVTSKRYILTDGAPRIGVEADQSLYEAGKRHRVANLEYVDCGPEVMDSISVDSVWRAVEVLTSK